jgi:hypothetical protein
LHFASKYDYQYEEDPTQWVSLENRYYSTFASTFNAEMELRLILILLYRRLRRLPRHRYNEINIDDDRVLGDPDMSGDPGMWVSINLDFSFRSATQIRDRL